MELVCPAGSLPALKEAVDMGADAVYIGFQDETNARHFSGLNFNDKKTQKAVEYARNKQVKIFIAINTYPQPSAWSRWKNAVDLSGDLGVNALIVADIGILKYACDKHPNIPRHLSVQGSCTSAQALNFYKREFDIQRAVLPRVLSLAQVNYVASKSPVDLEVFGFGSLCIMVEGRCFLSSYLTDESPNTCGACSPAKAVQWCETPSGRESRLNNILIDRYTEDEYAGYPTLCKGRFRVNNSVFHTFEEPTSLNTLELIPKLDAIGIKAIKLEGRQRSPAYVKHVVKVWREAIDHYNAHKKKHTNNDVNVAYNMHHKHLQQHWSDTLNNVSEGYQTTLGPYHRSWQ